MSIKQFKDKLDPDNLFDVIVNTWQQAEYAWNSQMDLTPLKAKKFSSLIVTGLGGSAISGNFIINFLKDELKLPLSVNRNYNLPLYAGPETLLIASSYSGNTEETISAVKEGLAKGCSIVCLSTGGTIKQIAQENNLPLVELKKGFQPRYALGSSFFTLLKVFQELSLIPDQSKIVSEIIALWKLRGHQLTEDGNPAAVTAERILGYIPVILSVADINDSLGMRLKAQLNENSKLHAFASVLPEHNHNEIVAWESFREEQANLATVIFQDELYHPQVKKRIAVVTELIAKTGSPIVNISSAEKSFKLRLCDMLYFADWVSYYAAMLRGHDPAEIDNIHYLKKKLSEN